MRPYGDPKNTQNVTQVLILKVCLKCYLKSCPKLFKQRQRVDPNSSQKLRHTWRNERNVISLESRRAWPSRYEELYCPSLATLNHQLFLNGNIIKTTTLRYHSVLYHYGAPQRNNFASIRCYVIWSNVLAESELLTSLHLTMLPSATYQQPNVMPLNYETIVLVYYFTL